MDNKRGKQQLIEDIEMKITKLLEGKSEQEKIELINQLNQILKDDFTT